MQVSSITPCLWCDGNAEAMANFYVSVFSNSKIAHISRYSEAGREQHKQTPGTVMVVAFELDGKPFTALNGGPMFKFNEAISFQVLCDTQEQVDYFWDKLRAGGDPKAQQCGWLKDQFGVSWQVVPKKLVAIVKEADSPKSQQAVSAMMGMKKIDMAGIEDAYEK